MRRAFPLLTALALLGSCAEDRGTASTEVENELQAARLSAVAEGPNAFVASPWTLLDSDGDTLASGTTDSSGAIEALVGIPDTSSALLLQVSGFPDTLRTVFFPPRGFSAGDTLRATANLLTESVVRAWGPGGSTSLDRRRLTHLGDSLVRSMGGLSMSYDRVASRPGDRDRPADVLLEVLSLQAGRSGISSSRFIDDLRRDPRRSILRDSAIARDLADGMRRLALPTDSQAVVAFQLDSLGGRDGALLRDWENDRFREDSALFTALLPWMAGTDASLLRRNLLERADRLGNEALRSLEGAVSMVPVDRHLRTVRRTTIRLWVHLLDDLTGPPTDSVQTLALEQLLRPAESSMRDAWKRLRLDSWTEKDSMAADFLRTAMDSRRDSAWSTSVLLTSTDPFSYSLSRWPLPMGSKLDSLLDSLAATRRWGDPSVLLRPAFRSSP